MEEFRTEALKKIEEREKQKKEQSPSSGGSAEFDVDEKGRIIHITPKSEKQKILEREFDEEQRRLEEMRQKALEEAGKLEGELNQQEEELFKKFQKLEEELRSKTRQLIKEEGDTDAIFKEIQELENQKENIAAELREARKPRKISID